MILRRSRASIGQFAGRGIANPLTAENSRRARRLIDWNCEDCGSQAHPQEICHHCLWFRSRGGPYPSRKLPRMKEPGTDQPDQKKRVRCEIEDTRTGPCYASVPPPSIFLLHLPSHGVNQLKMPLHIIAGENPENPDWGELLLEVYFSPNGKNLTQTPHNPTSPP